MYKYTSEQQQFGTKQEQSISVGATVETLCNSGELLMLVTSFFNYPSFLQLAFTMAQKQLSTAWKSDNSLSLVPCSQTVNKKGIGRHKNKDTLSLENYAEPWKIMQRRT